MKKRTVITTEKREVWVIRKPSGETKEHEIDGNEAESSVDSLIALLTQDGEADEATNEQD